MSTLIAISEAIQAGKAKLIRGAFGTFLAAILAAECAV